MPGGAPQVLGGPVWWFVFGVYVLALGLSLYVTIDSLRAPRRERLAELSEPSWLYTAIEGAFAVVALGVWIPAIPRVAAAVPVFAFPVALVFGFAYLLRVVFPKPSATGAGGRTGSAADRDSASDCRGAAAAGDQDLR
jgi:hypothetical protein